MQLRNKQRWRTGTGNRRRKHQNLLSRSWTQIRMIPVNWNSRQNRTMVIKSDHHFLEAGMKRWLGRGTEELSGGMEMFCVFMWISQNCSNGTLKRQNFQILRYSISDLYRQKEDVNLKIGGKVLPEVAQNWLLQESKSFLENIKTHAVDPRGALYESRINSSLHSMEASISSCSMPGTVPSTAKKRRFLLLWSLHSGGRRWERNKLIKMS